MQNFGNNQSDGHQSEGEDQADHDILDEASEDVSHKGHHGAGDGVGVTVGVVRGIAVGNGVNARLPEVVFALVSNVTERTITIKVPTNNMPKVTFFIFITEIMRSSRAVLLK